MAAKPIVYMDSCCFIDVVKQTVGNLPAFREDDVWHIKKLLEAHRAGDVTVVTSYLSIAECVAVEDGQVDVPVSVQEVFRRLLTSGQYVSLLQQTPRTAVRAQNLRWQHKLVLGGPDALHVAAAIEANASEFLTADERLKKPKLAAAANELKNMVRLIRASETQSLPEKYRQGDWIG